MSRTSNDQYRNGLLFNGYDYTRQAWVKDGFYVRCGHPESMNCDCFGRLFEGEPSVETASTGRMADSGRGRS